MEDVHLIGFGKIRFGVFEVDLRAGELRKQGVRIKLQDQPLQILQILLEHPGELVTREAIQKRIWPSDTFVDFDHGLYNAIKRLREALGDTAETPRYIETLPKRGYRFIGSLNGHAKIGAATTSNPHRHESERANPSLLSWLAIGAGVLLAGATTVFALDVGGIRSRFFTGPSPATIHSLAVIPLENLSGNANQEYFADGMTDALITELSQINSLKVISRTSTIRYKKTEKALPQVARELGVDGIVEGTVQRSGDRVRITVQLIYAPADQHVWAQSFEQNVADVQSLEQGLAVAIAQKIRARLTPEEAARFAESGPINPKALEAYLQGENLEARMSKGTGAVDAEQSIKYFQKAIAEDPNFAPAYAELADEYQVSYLRGNEAMPLAKVAVNRAIELDPQSAKAHEVLGAIRLFYDWDWQGAEAELQRALALNPNSSWTRNRYAFYLAVMGRLDEAKVQLQRAAELDPASPSGDGYGTGIFPIFRQYNQLIDAERKKLEFTPDDGYLHWELYRLYALIGMQRESIEELTQTWRLFGFSEVANAVDAAYSQSGYREALLESSKHLEELYEQKILFLPTEIARTYSFLGQEENALKWLRTAYEERDGDLILLKVDPAWDSLRSDPRFTDLVRRVGIP
jgi:TolB-like protein/DNA-binding winged helix-turn-helix (wHTH) protein